MYLPFFGLISRLFFGLISRLFFGLISRLFFGLIFRRREDNQDVISDISDCSKSKVEVE